MVIAVHDSEIRKDCKLPKQTMIPVNSAHPNIIAGGKLCDFLALTIGFYFKIGQVYAG